MVSKYFSIIIAPSDGRKTYNLQVSVRTVWLFGAVVLLLGSGMVFLVATYGGLLSRVRDRESLRERCVSMEAELKDYSVLQAEVEGLREMDRQVRRLVGMPDPVSDRSGRVDVGEWNDGGSIIAEDIVLEDTLFPDEEELEGLENQLRNYHHSLDWPLVGFVSSGFKEERAPGVFHPGLDIAAPLNTVVETPLAGSVVQAGWHVVYGNVVVIDHGRRMVSLYGHNSTLLVRVGEKVARGDAVALLGNSGESSAPHLHFEVRKNGYAIDPAFLLQLVQE